MYENGTKWYMYCNNMVYEKGTNIKNILNVFIDAPKICITFFEFQHFCQQRFALQPARQLAVLNKPAGVYAFRVSSIFRSKYT